MGMLSCTVCNRRARLVRFGLFVPFRQPEPAPPGKRWVFWYVLCRRCARPGWMARVEQAAARSAVTGSKTWGKG
jgi:hypothetical protein